MYGSTMKIILYALCAVALHLSAHGQDKATSLSSPAETTLGVTLSSYKYEERTFMALNATMAGLAWSQSRNLSALWAGGNWFVRTELRYANGQADYISLRSGTIDNTPNWLLEGRALVGKDFDMGSYVLAPYVGIGLRHLHNDLRTNDLRMGYRRDTRYTTLPIGVTHRFLWDNRHKVSTTLEYSHWHRGVHKARLSDQNPNGVDVRLAQKTGHGLRLSSMVQMGQWSVGPTVNFWKIDQSEVTSHFEPRNTTRDIGFQLMRHF